MGRIVERVSHGWQMWNFKNVILPKNSLLPVWYFYRKSPHLFQFFLMSWTFINDTLCVLWCLFIDVWCVTALFSSNVCASKKQMTQIKSNRWRCKQITDQTHFNFCFRNNDRKWKHSYIPLLFIFVADLFIFYPLFFINFQT